MGAGLENNSSGIAKDDEGRRGWGWNTRGWGLGGSLEIGEFRLALSKFGPRRDVSVES